MRLKKLTVYLVLMAMTLGAVSCKKSDTGAENAGQEQQANGSESAADSDKKRKIKGRQVGK